MEMRLKTFFYIIHSSHFHYNLFHFHYSKKNVQTVLFHSIPFPVLKARWFERVQSGYLYRTSFHNSKAFYTFVVNALCLLSSLLVAICTKTLRSNHKHCSLINREQNEKKGLLIFCESPKQNRTETGTFWTLMWPASVVSHTNYSCLVYYVIYVSDARNYTTT